MVFYPCTVNSNPSNASWTPYQKFVVALLAFLQFTVVLDFMILSPLGAILLDELHIGASEFGLVVSAYALSAGVSSLIAAGFADRFDRRKWLIFFYSGFVLGTLFCALAPTYPLLLMARIITGLFGGVIGSISYAIVADLFPYEMRGRVLGVVQTAFSASQVLGIPVGLYLATHYGWHSPFMMIVLVSLVVGVLIVFYLKPINTHLEGVIHVHPLKHLIAIASNTQYMPGFAATLLLATGGYMIMPFASAFSVNNLKISLEVLPMVYMATGASMIVSGPWVGRLSDKIGKMPIFAFGSLLSMAMILYYTRLGPISLTHLIIVNIILFLGLTSRMVSSHAMTSAVPLAKDRGAYMSINASLQQFSGGVAAWIAGLIVIRSTTGELQRYDILGLVVVGSMALTMILMANVNSLLKRRTP